MEWNFKPKSASLILQALSYRFCRLRLSNPSKLVISKKWKSRIALLVHNAWGLFVVCSVKSPFALRFRKRTRPCLKKSRGGGLNQTKHKQIMKAKNTQTIKLQPKNLQDRAFRIQLADLGLNFHKIGPATGGRKESWFLSDYLNVYWVHE